MGTIMLDKIFDNPALNNLIKLAARVLIAAIFIQAGFNKIPGYAGTTGYMASAGVPGALLPLVIAVELVGGLVMLQAYVWPFSAMVLK